MQPQRIGRYQVERVVGRGAMGVVYLAHDPAIGRPVAIKTISFDAGLPEREREEARRRFHREAQAAGRLIHPHIVTVLDVGEYGDGDLFIAMEYIDGPTLDRFADPGDLLPVDRVLHFVCQAAEALAFAHRHRIVHRDLKPANLMVADGDRVKITDFGLAKNPETELTHSGTLIGTPSYMSPEQIAGKTLDGRSDLFSLGIVLYELLTGTKPFPGDQISTVIYRVLNEEPPDAWQANPRVPTDLEPLLRRALHKDPAARFQTGSEMAKVLREYAAGAAPEATRIRQAPRSSVGPAGRSPRVPSARSRPGRGRGRTLLRGIAVLLVLGAAAAFVPEVREAVGRRVSPRLLSRLPFVSGGWLELAADRPNASFRLDGEPLPEARLRVAPELAGRLLTATDGCRRGELVLADPLPDGIVTVALQEPVLRRLRLESEPAGATVLLDGRSLAGTTPASVDLAACEAHELTLQVAGHVPASLSLPADGDWIALTHAPIVLPKLEDGRLRIDAPYLLQVFSGGERIGTSSETLRLAPGDHQLVFASRRHRVRAEQMVHVEAGESRTLPAPVPALGTVRINAFPGNATIVVDGIEAGPPPLEMEIAAGDHDVSVRWHVGRPAAARRSISVSEGAANEPVNFRQGGG